MQFASSLLKGTLLKRYKRFLADIRLEDGREITAHCANSGALAGLTWPGLPVWVSTVPAESSRKLKFTWELAYDDQTFIGVNTQYPNKLVEAWLQQGLIQRFRSMKSYRREVGYGPSSRIDFLIEEEDGQLCYVEVKNVHLKEGKTAIFPDSVTTRGAKQMRELMPLLEQGVRGMVLYVIQRNDVDYFDIARHIDPIYDQVFKEASRKGLQSLAYCCKVTEQAIYMDKEIPIIK